MDKQIQIEELAGGMIPQHALPRTADSRSKPDDTSGEQIDTLAQVVDLLSDGVLFLDRDWRITYANSTAKRVSRLSPEDIGTRTHWEIFPETVGSDLERMYRGVMRSRQPSRLEYFYQPFALRIDVCAMPINDGIALHYREISERKRVEALRDSETALREQNELLEVVQHAAGAATWDFDLEAGRISFGPGASQIFGTPLEELKTPADFNAIIYSSDLPGVREAIAEAVRAGTTVAIEFRVITPTGRRIWIESRGRAIQREPGHTHLRGLSIDISVRKQNEEALVASEERYRILAHLNPQAIWMGSPDGAIIYANQVLLDYTGQKVEELRGLGWLQAYFLEDREQVLDRWAQSVLTGVDHEVEARLVRAADGAVRWWSMRARAVRDETGAILHWLGVGLDIHDAKTASEILRRKQAESERQHAELETLYQTTPVGLSLFDPVELRCLRANERQAEILGLPMSQIVGRTLAEIAPMPGLEAMFLAAVAGTPLRNQVFEGVLPTRAGEHRVWNLSLTPVYGERRTVQAVTAAWLEITHLKRAEAALVQSEKLAAVGRLASSISHEINNPLEAITNLLFLIAHHDHLPEDLKVFVHMAQSELARVSQIATQTLRFHRQAVRPTLVTPSDLMDAVVNLYHGRLANSGIKVTCKYSTSTRVLCFENDIRQVLNNLIANAIDAMRGGGRLLIRAHDAYDRKGRRGVRLTVGDTGHGMSKPVQGRIFEPFFTTKDLNGTGLGLWISEGIVQRHHGRLSVRSSDDPKCHGTIFTLFLPCPEQDHTEENAA